MDNDNDNLRNFQDSGDVSSLLKFIEASGRDTEKYREAVGILAPVFKALSFGIQPEYGELDFPAAQGRLTEIQDIIKWMADSPKADMQHAAKALGAWLSSETPVDDQTGTHEN